MDCPINTIPATKVGTIDWSQVSFFSVKLIAVSKLFLGSYFTVSFITHPSFRPFSLRPIN